MAVVTEQLTQLIAKQVDDKGLVVWYDPEQAYGSAAAELTLPKTAVARFDGSFFKLRKEIDHLMNDGQPPRLVVYVPIEREKTHNALIELDCAGVVMQPRQQPPACNTRLSVVARNALKPILGEDQVADIEKQVEAGKLSLADLNALAEKGKDVSSGIVALVFGTANPQEVALGFLDSDQYDQEVVKKTAEKELRQLLQLSFDIQLPAGGGLDSWRAKLQRHLLLIDLFAALKEQVPAALSSIPVATTAAGIDACVRLTRTWRDNRSLRASYVGAAGKVEQEVQLEQHNLPVEPLLENESFLTVERTLLSYAETELAKCPSAALLGWAESRMSGFWPAVDPTIQARWALIVAAGHVLLEADRVAKALKAAPTNVSGLVSAYAGDDQPWCVLDTYHRHLESRKYNFEYAVGDDHDALDKLIAKAEQRYAEVGSQLAKLFVTQIQAAKHPIKGLLRQRDIFEKQVKPRIEDGKTAYVWVDALRFEMARELCPLLTDNFETELHPAIGTVPTITEVGMAALLPKAHETLKIVSAGGGKLAVEIAGDRIADRKDRIAFLRKHAGVPVFAAKLEDLLPKPNKKVREGIDSAQLILITSQEIDELGETDNMAQARLQIDSVLTHVRRGVRVLADHGVKNIVLVADHGHLFADEIGEDMKIDAPGGKTEDLHRRVWVGLGGNSEPSYLRTPLSSLGVDSEFDIATPWSFAVFKCQGGARAYFHGGMSPQELIVPVLVLRSNVKPAVRKSGVQWTLTPGTSKLTTRFFSVQIAGVQGESSLFGFEPPKVRVEIRANKKCVSVPVSASYGFEDATGEVSLRSSDTDAKRIEPNTVTVMLSEEISQNTVSIYLLDATTGAELAAPLTVDVAISM